MVQRDVNDLGRWPNKRVLQLEGSVMTGTPLGSGLSSFGMTIQCCQRLSVEECS